MDKSEIGEKVREIAKKAVDGTEFELIHTELVGSKSSFTVRVFIDKEGGITLDDCAEVSRKIDEMIENDDFIPDTYMLEVSSPGIERGLYSLDDFVKFSGQSAKLRTKSVINGQKNFRGVIVSANADGKIEFNDVTSGKVDLVYENISKANLDVDLAEELKRK